MTPLLALLLAAPMSLGEAVTLARETSPELRAADARVAQAQAGGIAALGVLDTVLTAELGYTARRQLGQDFTGGAENVDASAASLGLRLTQPLVWGTRLGLGLDVTRLSTDSAFQNCIPGLSSDACHTTAVSVSVAQPLLRGFGREVVEAPQAEARAAEQVAERGKAILLANLVTEVTRAYVELAYARAALAIRQEALELARQQKAATEARIQSGHLAAVDRPSVEQAVAERALAVVGAEKAVRDAEATLSLLTGQDAAPEVAIPAVEPWSATEAEAQAAAAAAHPDLAAQDAEIERLRSNTVALSDATRPRLDLTLSASQSGLDEGLGGSIAEVAGNDVHTYAAQLALEWPWQGRAAEGQAARARHAIDEALANRAGKARDVRGVVGETWRAVKTAEQTEASTREIAALAERSLAAERDKFALGRATNLEVLAVQQQYAEALLRVERARADRVNALARLLAAVRPGQVL